MTKDRCQFPNHRWVKVNVDGSVLTFKPRATIGGVVRGLNGSCMGGFEMVVGLANVFQIEARALLEGLKFSWAKGYHTVEIESDNSILVAVIQNGLVGNNNYDKILRESNRVTDRIAREARGEMEHLITHEEPPKR
ncbi:hypothetical protein Golob_001374, partial [Gossypium lobatum]|nr:hypothetical protein [Gossypium lobatum]